MFGIEFYHMVDIIPFVLGTLIVIYAPTRIKSLKGDPVFVLILIATVVYMLAQSSWFSAFLEGNEWGRGLANYMWFVFNTLVMGIFLWVLSFDVDE